MESVLHLREVWRSEQSRGPWRLALLTGDTLAEYFDLDDFGNHTFRPTGITAYLKNGKKLAIVQQIAAHESSPTTELYNRRDDDVNLDGADEIGI